MPFFYHQKAMSKSIILSLLLFVITIQTIQSQPNQTITPIKQEAMHIFDFKQHDITYNDITYRVYIATPTINNPAPHPVLYMLDGNGQFPLLINQIETTNQSTPIIVGIGYPTDKAYPQERTRDYTPPTSQQFLSFITTKLKPYIETNYNINTTCHTLAGHSFGGLFVLYTLFHQPTQFQHYVAGSPSLWWGNGAILPTTRPLLSHTPQSITITLGQYEENPEADPERKHLSPEVLAQKDARRGDLTFRQLHTMLAAEAPNSQIIIYEGKNHGSSINQFLMEAFNTASGNTAKPSPH